jgi:hypothetical protein
MSKGAVINPLAAVMVICGIHAYESLGIVNIDPEYLVRVN